MHEKALALQTEVLGEKHPSTLISLNNLARLYNLQGRYDLAEPMYEKALALETEALGEENIQAPSLASIILQCFIKIRAGTTLQKQCIKRH